MSKYPVELSDLSVPNTASMRGVLIETLKRDAELFLMRTTHLDTLFLITTVHEYYSPQGINPTDQLCYQIINNDLHHVYQIPFRIALIGWMVNPVFPLEILERYFNYAMGYSVDKETDNMREVLYRRIEEGSSKPEVIPYFLKGETYVARKA